MKWTKKAVARAIERLSRPAGVASSTAVARSATMRAIQRISAGEPAS